MIWSPQSPDFNIKSVIETEVIETLLQDSKNIPPAAYLRELLTSLQ